jgi:hypothetical protein
MARTPSKIVPGGPGFKVVDADQVGETVDAKVFTAAERAKLGDLQLEHIAGLILALAAKAGLESPALRGTPTAPTAVAGTNTDQIATTAFVQTIVAALVNGTPAQLDTIRELAAALGDDGNFAATVTAALAGKATTAQGAKADSAVQPGAAVNVLAEGPDAKIMTAAERAKLGNLQQADIAGLVQALAAMLVSPAFSGAPTAPTAPAGTNTQQLATTAFVQAVVAALVNGTPAQLDTIRELAAALGDDANFAATMTAALASKATAAQGARADTAVQPGAQVSVLTEGPDAKLMTAAERAAIPVLGTKVRSGLAPLQSLQLVGRQAGTPDSGTAKVANGTYVFADAILSDAPEVTLSGFNGSAAGTLAIKRFLLAGSTLSQIAADIPVAIPSGAYSITIPVSALKGEYLGFFTGGASGGNVDSRVTYTSGSGAAPHSGFWSAAGNAVTVDASGSPASPNAIELAFGIAYTSVTNARVAAVEAKAESATQLGTKANVGLAPLLAVQKIGRLTGPPGAGTGKVTNSTYVFATPLLGDAASVTLVGYNPSAAGTLAVKRLDPTGARIGADVAVPVPSGDYSILVQIGALKGEYLGFFTGGVDGAGEDSRVSYTAGSGAAPHSSFWSAPGNASSVNVSGAPAPNNAIELRFEIGYTAVTGDRVTTIEADLTAAKAQSAALFNKFKVTKVAGVSALSASTSPLSPNMFALPQDIPAGAIPRTVRVTNPQTTAGLIHVKQMTFDAATSTYNQVGADVDLTVQPGVNTIDITNLMSARDFVTRIAAHNGAASNGDTANKRIAATGGVTGTGYVGNGSSSGNVTSFTNDAITTNGRVEFGFDYDVVEVPQASRQTTVALIDRMLAGSDAARSNNPRRNAPASGVTVSIGTAAPAAPFAQFPAAVTAPTSLDPNCVITGGWKVYSNGQVIPLAITKTPNAMTGGGGGQSYQAVHRKIYVSDAPVHYVKIQQAALLPFRVIVDDQYVAGTFVCSAINTDHYLKIDCGSRKNRTFKIEIAGNGSSSGRTSFCGWMVTPADTIRKPVVGTTVAIFGDSMTKAANATYPGDGYANVFGDLGGIQSVWPSGLSGTGYVTRGAGNSAANLLERITDLTQNNYDVGVIRMGSNDMLNDDALTGATTPTVTAALTQAQVIRILTAVMAAKPTTPYVIYGPWRKADQNTLAPSYEAAIKAAVLSFNNPYFAFVPTIGATPPLQTGSGYAGNAKGDGNSDFYLDVDGLHGNTAGHNYFGEDMSVSFFTALQQIKAALA